METSPLRQRSGDEPIETDEPDAREDDAIEFTEHDDDGPPEESGGDAPEL